MTKHTTYINRHEYIAACNTNGHLLNLKYDYLTHFESVQEEKWKVLLSEDCDNLRSHKCTYDLYIDIVVKFMVYARKLTIIR